MALDLKRLYFGAIPVKESNPAEEIVESAKPELTEQEIADNALDAILCADCGKNSRMSMQALLCKECDDKRRAGIIEVIPPKPQVEQSSGTMINGISELRQLTFAPVSVRYSGKELDQIAWSMLPSLPEELKLDIRKMVIKTAREFVGQEIEPTIQDIDANAEFFHQLSGMLRALSTARKDKILLAAKPELKRIEKERKETEKEKKIQSSIPKDIVSKHTANVLLKGIAEITAPLDKPQQTTLKAFLDYVSLQAQVEDEIDGKWLTGLLSKPKYQSLKQYIKILEK